MSHLTNGPSHPRPGRRAVLRATALGAGALAAPGLLTSATSGPLAHAAGRPRPPRILRGDTYPVGLWVAPPPHETTVERYAEIAAAGFTFVIGIDGCGGFCTPGETVTADNAPLLNASAANGLDALVFDKRIGHIHTYPQEQWPEIIESTLREYQGFPAFAGFDIRDEPNAALFPQIGAVNQGLRGLDPDVLGYVNLFPTYASPDMLGTPTYEEHLARYVAEATPDFISFDHYPFFGPSPALREDYFYNWVLVRRRALEADLPSWVFILACSHYGYRLPTEAELAWQINVSLAYGCKGIQYFTYWTPPLDGFYEALVTVEGELTPLYYIAQRVNNDYLRPVGKQLLPLVSESVTHAGEVEPPMGVEVFTGDDWVESTAGDAVVLSRFTDRRRPHQRWLLVVNRAFDAPSTTTLQLHRSVRAIFEFDTSRERFVPVVDGHGGDGGDGSRLTVALEAGRARLYRLHGDDRAGEPS